MEINRNQLIESVRAVLGEDGLLQQQIPNFTFRKNQLAMAEAIADSFVDGVPIIAEGGTGIGKTLAYLVPALLSGYKTVVATGTKTLQEQIFYKDLPALLETFDFPVRVTYMKGRSNYLCRLRYQEFTKQRLFRFASDASFFDTIEDWVAITQTGDRSELSELPDNYATWSDLTSTSDSCLGSKCRFYKECFVTEMRRRAQEADLIIVNHHLYFADLAVREHQFGEVIPNHDIVIFDEAHQLESVATQYFGTEVSNVRLYALTDDIRNWAKTNASSRGGLFRACEEIRIETANLFDFFTGFDGRFRLAENVFNDALLRDTVLQLDTHLDTARRALVELGSQYEEAEALAQRTGQVANDLALIIDEQDAGFVYWGEKRKRSVAISRSPLDISEFMAQSFLHKHRNTVFTSATLSTNENFDYFRTRLGLLPETREVLFPSPFNYRHQTMLYIPRKMPEPSQPKFTQNAAAEIERLLRLSGGGALVLFTSYANLDDVHERLVDRLPFPLLRQGEAPRIQLLEQFRDKNDSVLFATGTFWQGVDVLGSSLRMVIIDKLPFESPGEPITEARIQYLRDQGMNPFSDYQVPTAIISLRQGVGRLVRDTSDWGVIAILDRRLVTKGYGKRFLASLPPSQRADQIRHVEAWWNRRRGIADLKTPD